MKRFVEGKVLLRGEESGLAALAIVPALVGPFRLVWVSRDSALLAFVSVLVLCSALWSTRYLVRDVPPGFG